MGFGTVLAGIGVVVFAAAVLGVGTRLLFLARRTRQLPELLIGLAFLGCGVGYLEMIAARAPALGAYGHSIHLMGRGAFSVGCACVALATWRIFRPHGAGPLALMYAMFLALGASVAADLLFVEPSMRSQRPLFWFGFAGNASVFAWAAYESFRYHGMLRRQLRIGLSSPAVARRVLLWAVAASCIVAIFPVAAWSALERGDTLTEGMRTVSAVLTSAAAVCIWAAFFPKPKRLVPRSGV